MCLLALIVFPSVPGAALAQSTPDMQKVLERLDKLEKQNQELLTEIQALRRELGQPLGRTGCRLLPRTGRRRPRIDANAWTCRRAARRNWRKRKSRPLSGFRFRSPAWCCSMPSATGVTEAGCRIRSRPGLTPRLANTGATFRQTVLGLKFNGPDLPGGGTASGSVYMDFFGGNSAPSNNLFQLRLATLSLTWKNTTITAGQDKPIMSPREPTSLAQVGLAPLTGAGNLWDWNPQVRVEQRIPFTGVRRQ